MESWRAPRPSQHRVNERYGYAPERRVILLNRAGNYEHPKRRERGGRPSKQSGSWHWSWMGSDSSSSYSAPRPLSYLISCPPSQSMCSSAPRVKFLCCPITLFQPHQTPDPDHSRGRQAAAAAAERDDNNSRRHTHTNTHTHTHTQHRPGPKNHTRLAFEGRAINPKW